ncbi:diaminopimelate decarboxylase [Spirochaetota bacterium]
MFTYRDSILFIENVPYTDIIEKYDTPVYVYSKQIIIQNSRRFKELFKNVPAMRIFFSVKSCSNISILKIMKQEGLGADIVSGGELYRCIKAGYQGKDIVYSGVGKTEKEIEYAIKSGILFFNAESVEEIYVIQSIAQRLRKRARLSFRMNPDIDAGTHHKITTGKKESKFGIVYESIVDVMKNRKDFPNIDFIGIDVHIGSQILSPEPFQRAFERIMEMKKSLIPYGLKADYIDFGGGFGIVYDPRSQQDFPYEEYKNIIANELSGSDCNFIIEPGRSIVGNAAVLITKVLYTKETYGKKYIIVDAGFNDLLRPAMYDAYHDIRPCTENNSAVIRADIAGPLCETGDVFAKEREIHPVSSGEHLSIFSAGAYGASMSSMYNSHPLAGEVLVEGGKVICIRKPYTYRDMVLREK